MPTKQNSKTLPTTKSIQSRPQLTSKTLGSKRQQKSKILGSPKKTQKQKLTREQQLIILKGYTPEQAIQITKQYPHLPMHTYDSQTINKITSGHPLEERAPGVYVFAKPHTRKIIKGKVITPYTQRKEKKREFINRLKQTLSQQAFLRNIQKIRGKENERLRSRILDRYSFDDFSNLQSNKIPLGEVHKAPETPITRRLAELGERASLRSQTERNQIKRTLYGLSAFGLGMGQAIVDFPVGIFKLGKNVAYDLPKWIVQTPGKDKLEQIQNLPEKGKEAISEIKQEIEQSSKNKPAYSLGYLGGIIYAPIGYAKTITKISNKLKRLGMNKVQAEEYLDKTALKNQNGLVSTQDVEEVMRLFKNAEGQAVTVTASKGLVKELEVLENARRRFKGKATKPEDTGLWISPKGSGQPHFLGIKKPSSLLDYEITLNPFKTSQPNIVSISLDEIKFFPKKVLDDAIIEVKNGRAIVDWDIVNQYHKSQAGKGSATISARRTVGHTNEPEAIIPVGSKFQINEEFNNIIQRLRKTTKYIEVEGETVPIYDVKLLKEAKSNAPKLTTREIKNLASSSYDASIGKKYITPYEYITYARRSPYYRNNYERYENYLQNQIYNNRINRNIEKYPYRTNYTNIRYPSYPGSYQNLYTPNYYNYPYRNISPAASTVPPPIVSLPKKRVSKNVTSKKKEDRKVSGWTPVQFNNQGHLLKGATYRTKIGARNAGIDLTDQNAFHKFRIIKENADQSDLKEAKPTRKLYKFKSRGGTYIEKKQYRNDNSKESSFNIMSYKLA